MFKDFSAALTPRARWGLAIGALFIIAIVASAGMWLLRTDYQVLFADLRPQDSALMVAELDKQKIEYRLGDDGTSILVDSAIVHGTRLKLMGKELPLHGVAGFELFNNGDFGMTEFAQKINYQRALQGEITRTILSLSEVREARVHLALPEESLFKRANSKPKAAITLSLKAGQTLRADQVNGIQRLVAGAVPGIAAQDVTIVDQQGVALTRAAATEAEAETTGGARLDLKRDMERLLARKATEVLERAFGPGQAMASVDVTLNMDQVRVTTEDVIGTPGQPGQAPSGVVVREREVQRDMGAPLSTDASGRASNSQREVDYQVGRRVEQVVTQPGALRRLHVAAVVRHPLDAQQLEQAKALVAAAVGGVAERGDTIVVQTLMAFNAQPLPAAAPLPGVEPGMANGKQENAASDLQRNESTRLVLAAGVALLVIAVAVLLSRGRRPRGDAVLPPLTASERQVLATQMKHWLEQGREMDVKLPPVAGTQAGLPGVRP